LIDYVCNWIGGEVVANNIDSPGFSTAGFANITSSDDIVHGVSKQSDNFAFVRIYEAGTFLEPDSTSGRCPRNMC